MYIKDMNYSFSWTGYVFKANDENDPADKMSKKRNRKYEIKNPTLY